MKEYAIALGAILLFGGILPFLPFAEAAPIHSKSVIPLSDLPGNNRALTESISAPTAAGNPGVLNISMWGVWYCPIGPCIVDFTTTQTCIDSLLAPVAMPAQRKYILRLTTDATPATGSHDASGAGGPSTISVDPFFGGGGTHMMTFDMNAAVPGVTVEWVELTQAGVGHDQVNLAGQYFFVNCGVIVGVGADSIQTPFVVQVPVGGEILPINTSALLLAGLTTNALWILPALAVIAGAGIVILKFQLNRKTI